jgi:hypothetical protein
VSTTVVLEVTPHEPIDPDRHANEVPSDLTTLLAKAGQPLSHGLSRRGTGPWRLHFQLAGPERAFVAPALLEKVRALGYDADLLISP